MDKMSRRLGNKSSRYERTFVEDSDHIDYDRSTYNKPAHSKSSSGSFKSSKPPSAENPFVTPSGSSYPSATPSSIGDNEKPVGDVQFFQSRRIKKEEIERPWLLEKQNPKLKWLNWIPVIGVLLGIAVGGYMVYDGISSVPKHEYCSIYEENFASGSLDDKIWTKEVQVGGFGNGQFEETTDSDENVFIADGALHIRPTLQDSKLIENNNVINLTQLGTCTSDEWYNCVAVTNTTNGTIVNPVRSARLNTKKGASIKFGRIEVEARTSTGDWLWPSIWMLPTKNVYGDWPYSGEIDIMETRGNNYSYPLGGNDMMSSALHWGPDATNDAWWRTFKDQRALMTTFSKTFHTFGLEWSEKYLYTYLDGRLLQVLYTRFNKPFWRRGHFPLSDTNGTTFVDPWSQTGRGATPFDEDFYLILTVAVGGTNGWFEDGKAGKPWVDAAPSARHDFWNARDQWYPTWGKGDDADLVIKSVKMWQQKGYNGC